MNHYESFEHQEKYKVVNGKVIENSEINQYNKNGKVWIEGFMNGKHFLYNNNDPNEDFSKKVHFVKNVTPKTNRIVRTKTPYRTTRKNKRRKMKTRKNKTLKMKTRKTK